MKLHGCGKEWKGPGLRKKLQRFFDAHPESEDPFWDLLKESGQLSPEEIETGEHAPVHGWAKEFREQQLKKMD